MSPRVRVLVADDSPATQVALCAILSADPRIEVVGAAADGVEALELARSLRPDVITMDVQMPRMDGLAATAAIMVEAPARILVVASVLSEDQQALSFRAMSAGALEVIPKPHGITPEELRPWGGKLADSICLMAEVPVVTRRRTPAPAPLPRRTTGRVDAVGLVASTGGPPALGQILGALPADLPVPILVAQHIASGFIHGMRRWLSEVSRLQIQVVRGATPLRPGTVYLAEDGTDLIAGPDGLAYPRPPSGTYRPSGNRLLSSLARAYGARAGGFVLTGMGEDGAQGLLEIRLAGGAACAQDEATSVVFGMPQAASRLGAVESLLPLPAIASAIVELCAKRKKETV